MSKLMPWYADFTQAPFDGGLDGITSASISDAILPHVSDRYFPPFVHVAVVLDGAVTNTDVTVSLGVIDLQVVLDGGGPFWTVPATQEIRTIPDDSVVAGRFTFQTLRAASIKIALESAITGGGSAKLFIAFTEENL